MQVWLDVDTGIDDAIALLAASGGLAGDRFGFVSTVSGNVGLLSVVENTRRVLAAAGRDDVDVYRGADRPILREPIDAADVHGKSGLGSVSMAPARRPLAGDLLDLTQRLALQPDGDVCLVATAPLTNVALLARLAPELLRRKVGRTVWMGGGRGTGNTTAAAEFNAYADPEAAAIALEVLAPVTVVHLGTTRSAYLTAGEVASFGDLGARGILARNLLQDPAYQGISKPDRVIVHDAVALLEALAPGEIFATTRETIQVDLSGGPSYGATLCGRRTTGPDADWSGAPVRERFVAGLRAALSGERALEQA